MPLSYRRVNRGSCRVTGAFVATTVSLFGCSSANHSPVAAQAIAATEPAYTQACPFEKPSQWRAFLEQVAEHEQWVETCEDGDCSQEFGAFVKTNIVGTLASCADFIDRNPKVAACTEHLRRFVPAWTRQHTNKTHGFMLENADYFAYETGKDKPAGLMTVPPAIIAAMPDPAKVEAAARANGLKYLIHTSCLGGTRLYITYSDPGGSFDQWMLLNLFNADGKADTTTLPASFIGVQKKDAAGNTLPKVRLNFRDYYLTPSGHDGAYTLTSPPTKDGKCYSCHSSGTRKLMLVDRQPHVLAAKAVRGEAGYDATNADVGPDIGEQRLTEFNKTLMSYGLPDWDGTINVADHGPALGADQGCTNCHDGRNRGVLTVSMSTTQLDRKLFEELAMPPEPGLPELLLKAALASPRIDGAEEKKLGEAEDRHSAIESDFFSSRLPTLRKWLLEQSCE